MRLPQRYPVGCFEDDQRVWLGRFSRDLRSPHAFGPTWILSLVAFGKYFIFFQNTITKELARPVALQKSSSEDVGQEGVDACGRFC